MLKLILFKIMMTIVALSKKKSKKLSHMIISASKSVVSIVSVVKNEQN
jgi:hypothetical protein